MPIVYPTDGSRIGRVIGIDPGTINLGFCALEFDIVNGKILGLDAISYNADKLFLPDDLLSISHSDRTARLMAHKDNLLHLFQGYQPIAICSEAPFYNHLRPIAFGALTECVTIIKMAAIEYNPMVPFYLFEPSIVKKGVGAGAISGKDAVKKAVLQTEEILIHLPSNKDEIDEHSIDSIAVAYVYLQQYRKRLSEGQTRC